MPLSKGDRLGPYEILALVGKGGMGEVYRAHDERVRRDVAIKVSSAQFTERFAQEARAIAALNHTNICHLYDVATSPDGFGYLVMEYVEGEDLKGPLGFDEGLPIVRQLIDGIEAAHEKNIVHRDLKPANIKITPEGVVKILDFGVAKPMDPAPSSGSDAGNSPTLTMGPTAMGTILGTAAYMAPEQARGKQADKRSDIWSFGVILFELLTGQKMFTGETPVEILGSVLKKDPDLSVAPARVRKLLSWCLEKDRKQRLASISDARRLLEEEPPAPVAAPPPRHGTTGWMLAACILAPALAAVSFIHFREAAPERPLIRLDVDLGADVALPLPVGGASDIGISPDGTRIVYNAGSIAAGTNVLHVRNLDQAQATELTKGGNPVFSPDGQWIAFEIVGSRGISKISVEGGAVVPVTNQNVAGAGFTWMEGGGFVVSQRSKGLMRIGTTQGNPETITELAQGETLHSYPRLLPGGKAVLFVAQGAAPSDDSKTIEVVTLADHRRKVLVRGGTSPHYLPTGHLIYTNKSTLFGVPFDLDKLEVRGAAVPLVSDIASSQSGVGQFDISATGTLIYRKASQAAASNSTIEWVDASGKRQPLLAKPAPYGRLRFSPDGRRLALQINDGGQSDLWVYDVQRDAMTRLTSLGLSEYPEWSADGKYIAFTNANELYFTRSDGAIQPQVLLPGKARQLPSSFSPDNKRLAYSESAAPSQIWTVPLEEQDGRLKAGQPEQFLKSTSIDGAGRFSPDGHWMAYASFESGKVEIYVRAFPPPASGIGGKWQISNNGAGTGASWWARNGHELYYRQGDQLMAVSYTAKGDVFLAEKPRVWIPKLGGTVIDIAPDDKRVAVVTATEEAAPQQEHELVMLLNFFDEVRRRVPGK